MGSLGGRDVVGGFFRREGSRFICCCSVLSRL